jgi:hypothetical protein
MSIVRHVPFKPSMISEKFLRDGNWISSFAIGFFQCFCFCFSGENSIIFCYQPLLSSNIFVLQVKLNHYLLQPTIVFFKCFRFCFCFTGENSVSRCSFVLQHWAFVQQGLCCSGNFEGKTKTAC